MSQKTRILLVEDESSISEPLTAALEREGFEVVVARTAAEAQSFELGIDPDVVLLDLMLPDGDGRDVCRVIRGHSDVPIIMLTARGTETDKIVGLEIGADDYMVKPFSSGELVARIRALLRRTSGTSAQPVHGEFGKLAIDEAARTVLLDGTALELTRKEFDLLAELTRHAGEVVLREDLMTSVWDENWFGSTKTLDVHIGWLRKKIGDDPQHPHFIHTVRGVGFRFSPPQEPTE